MWDHVLLGFGEIMNGYTLLYIAVGVAAGLVIGSIPGFTVTEGVALTLPLTYGMSAVGGIATMIGVFVGAMTGGLISATLLGIPGTGAAIATTFDGHPMASRGEPGRALALGIVSSFIGGILGGVILVVAAPWLARWALDFGPWEYFSMTLFALTVIASLTGDSLLKGLLSGTVGLFVSMVGMDKFLGVERFTFGFYQLSGGFSFIPVLIGLYAFSQIMTNIEDGVAANAQVQARFSLRQEGHTVMKDLSSSTFNLIRSSAIGTLVGILPAAGGSIANILSYDQAKKGSKHPELFGKGSPEGVIAAESANNALAGGALIPTLAFGMPGDAATAVMLGALMLHGIEPGPLLFSTQPGLSYGIIASYLVANVMMFVILSGGLKAFTQVFRLPGHVLFPYVLIFCAIGSFALHHRVFDIWILFGFGVLGYLLRKGGFPLPPLVLGLILGPMAEVNLRRAVMTDYSLLPFVTRPISLFFLILAVVSVGYAVRPQIQSLGRKSQQVESE